MVAEGWLLQGEREFSFFDGCRQLETRRISLLIAAQNRRLCRIGVVWADRAVGAAVLAVGIVDARRGIRTAVFAAGVRDGIGGVGIRAQATEIPAIGGDDFGSIRAGGIRHTGCRTRRLDGRSVACLKSSHAVARLAGASEAIGTPVWPVGILYAVARIGISERAEFVAVESVRNGFALSLPRY